LNTRYKGSVTAYGYRTQSNLDESASKGYGLMAGAALLKGIGSNINYGPPSAIAYPGTPGGGT
jgi:hypothetical protein